MCATTENPQPPCDCRPTRRTSCPNVENSPRTQRSWRKGMLPSKKNCFSSSRLVAFVGTRLTVSPPVDTINLERPFTPGRLKPKRSPFRSLEILFVKDILSKPVTCLFAKSKVTFMQYLPTIRLHLPLTPLETRLSFIAAIYR